MVSESRKGELVSFAIWLQNPSFSAFDHLEIVIHPSGMPLAPLREEDLQESFARSSGPGGQHVNKVSTAVTLTHLPSGLSVTVSDSRSQSMNRRIARERLAEKISVMRLARRQKFRAEASKVRRSNPKRSRSEKRKLVEGKRRRSEVKKSRGRVSE